MARGPTIDWQRLDPLLAREHAAFPRRSQPVIAKELGISHSALGYRARALGFDWKAPQAEPTRSSAFELATATPPSKAARKLAEFDPAVRQAVELYDQLTASSH